MAPEGDDTRCDVYGTFLDQLASICFPEDARTNSINLKYLPLLYTDIWLGSTLFTVKSYCTRKWEGSHVFRKSLMCCCTCIAYIVLSSIEGKAKRGVSTINENETTIWEKRRMNKIGADFNRLSKYAKTSKMLPSIYLIINIFWIKLKNCSFGMS